MNQASMDNSDHWPDQSHIPMDEADRLRERLFLAPNDIDSISRLAALREAAGDLPGAIDLYQRALRVDPYRLEMVLSLGRLWVELDDRNRAASWLKRALEIEPDCAEAAALASTLEHGPELTSAYIKTLFDQYADRFDDELTGTLNYRAPELVAAILGNHRQRNQDLDILDLGCGTGLSGVALRPFARRLDGMDLSPGMIAKARLRGIYASTDIAEAVNYLSASSQSWHVIAAVDMLNYLGDLAPLFEAAAARLRSTGLLAGTVEGGAGERATLTAKKRYTHSREHLIAASDKAGLQLVEIMDGVLRQESGAPVAGLVFIACAKAS